VCTVIAFWLVVISLLSFLKVNPEQSKLIIGIIANIITFLFYGAPLSTIVTVLKTRDSWRVILMFVNVILSWDRSTYKSCRLIIAAQYTDEQL
jgi:hypothetical protein